MAKHYNRIGIFKKKAAQPQRRTDLLTASRLDFGLTLLPLLGRQNVARMLACQNLPMGLVMRVLASQSRREISD